jgi:sporulation protein YlmC with PRC-barrel domain
LAQSISIYDIVSTKSGKFTGEVDRVEIDPGKGAVDLDLLITPEDFTLVLKAAADPGG